jgi:hypothetical protein
LRKPVPFLAVTAILLSGCTPSSPETTPTHGPVDHARQTPKPPQPASPGSGSASAGKFAGIISKNEKTWRDFATNIDACNRAAEGRTPDDYIQAMGCIKNAQNAANLARNATTEILALGPPPPELTVLVAATLNALTPLSTSNAATTCQDATSDPCANSVDKIDEAAPTLVAVLDDWAPYKQPN